MCLMAVEPPVGVEVKRRQRSEDERPRGQRGSTAYFGWPGGDKAVVVQVICSLPRTAGVHVARAVHATAQAVWDVRRLLSWIRSQQPDSPIGLNSISLGGYVTSLVASLEDGLTCAILGVVTELFHSSISRPFLIPISRMGHCGARSWAERPFLVGDGAAEPGTYDSMTGASSAVAAPNRGGSRDRKDPRRFNLPVRTLAFGVAGSQPRHLATVPRGRGLVHDVGRSGEVPVSPALSSA